MKNGVWTPLLRLAVTVTKSDAGIYAGKLDSLDQGASIPIDAITVKGDAVRLEIKSPAIVIEGTLNKERTELTGTFTQSGQQLPLTFTRTEAVAMVPPPKPKPDYSAPADAPYVAEEVVVKTLVADKEPALRAIVLLAGIAQPRRR